MKKINSPLFGPSTLLEEEDEALHELKELVQDHPANAFEILEDLIRNKGFRLSINMKLEG